MSTLFSFPGTLNLNPNLPFLKPPNRTPSRTRPGAPKSPHSPILAVSVPDDAGSESKSRRRDPPPSPDGDFAHTRPRKPRRGRRSEAAMVEDFVRGSLERTFAAIRKQNSGALEGKDEVLKERVGEEEEGEQPVETGNGVVVEEEDSDWPADADVGWGIRASEYFEKHPITNVVVDGVEIDWEGEMQEGWVKEINCLEWERFAFHPSPLIVLVFERYNRAIDNWRVLKELEKAAKVYWSARDRLPPRTIKIDINIETDLAYALKVRDCPQLLFLKGNKILYREKEYRTSDELVQMIAHFYYNSKKPSWVDASAIASPY